MLDGDSWGRQRTSSVLLYQKKFRRKAEQKHTKFTRDLPYQYIKEDDESKVILPRKHFIRTRKEEDIKCCRFDFLGFFYLNFELTTN
jgi:hypothetical protein